MESANLNLYPPAEIGMRKLIESWSFDMPEVSLNYSSSNVTPQFAKLVRILQSYESRGQDFRGIIVGTLQVIIIIFYLHDSYLCCLNIVKHRPVAIMMAELLRYVDETSGTIHPLAVTTELSDDEQVCRKYLDVNYIY